MQLTDFKSGMSAGVLGATGLTMAAGLAAGAVIGLGKAAYGAVEATKNYRLEIGDLASALSTTAEEASVLYNLADDQRVQLPAIEMAFKTMARNGLQPSIVGLVELASKYQAIQDPQAKVKFLTDNFGRSGLDLARIMDMDSEAILGYGDSLKDGLRVTGAQVQASKDLYAAQDQLGEQWLSMRNTIFGAVIPGLTAGIEGTNRWMDAWGAFADPLYQDIPFLMRGMAAMRDSAKERDLQEYLATLGDPLAIAAQAARGLASGIEGIDDSAGDAAGSLGAVKQTLEELLGLDTGSLDRVAGLIAGIKAEEAEVGASELGLKALGTMTTEGVIPPLSEAKQYLMDMAAIDLAGNVTAGTTSVIDAKAKAQELGLSWQKDVLPKLDRANTTLMQMALDRTASFTIRVKYVYGEKKPDTRAAGGPLTGLNLVGEQGPELIINGVVVPAAETRKLLSLGLTPDAGMALGGGLRPPPGKMPSITRDVTVPRIKAERSSGGPAPIDGGGAGVEAPSGLEVQVAAAMAAPAAMAASLPATLAAGFKASNVEARESATQIVREIRSLKQELARSVSAAVQRAM